METPVETRLLYDIVVVLGLAVAVAYVCNRARIPTIVGFLLTGVIAGPHDLGAIEGVHEVEVLAEIGVLLLLFTSAPSSRSRA